MFRTRGKEGKVQGGGGDGGGEGGLARRSLAETKGAEANERRERRRSILFVLAAIATFFDFSFLFVWGGGEGVDGVDGWGHLDVFTPSTHDYDTRLRHHDGSGMGHSSEYWHQNKTKTSQGIDWVL